MVTHISTRYFVVLLENKEKAKETYHLIEKFLNEHLKLELNKKSRYYPNKFGCNFCGYVIYETHILLRKRFKKKAKKNIKKWNHFYLENKLNIHDVQMRWNSMFAHASHANSYSFISLLYKSAYFNKYLKR